MILSSLLPLQFARVAVCMVLVASCFSQSSAPKAASDQTTVVNVNEVSLNLVVRTKKGKLVPDLKPEDIAITDGGIPVKISRLNLVTGDSGEHLLTLVFDRLDSSSGHNARDIAGKILKMVPANGFSFCVMKAQGRLMLYHDFTSDRAALNAAIAQATDDEQSHRSKGFGSSGEAFARDCQDGERRNGRAGFD